MRSVPQKEGPAVTKPPVESSRGDGRAALGLKMATATRQNAAQLGVQWTPGVLVLEISPDSLASQAGLHRNDVIILDDLKPGVLMSHAASVPIAAAGWGHDIPPIREYMKDNCIAYFNEVSELRHFLME